MSKNKTPIEELIEKLEAQQKEIEKLKTKVVNKEYYRKRALKNKTLLQDSLKEIEQLKSHMKKVVNIARNGMTENTKLKEELEMHKGISDSKSLIIKELNQVYVLTQVKNGIEFVSKNK